MKPQTAKPDANEMGFKICAVLATLMLLYFLPYPLSTQSRQNEALSSLLKDCNRIEILKNPPQGQLGIQQNSMHVATLRGAQAKEFTEKIRLSGKRIPLLGEPIHSTYISDMGPDYSLLCYQEKTLKCAIGYKSGGQISCDELRKASPNLLRSVGFIDLSSEAKIYVTERLGLD